MPANAQSGVLLPVLMSGGLAVLCGTARHAPLQRAGWRMLAASVLLFGLGAGCWFLYSVVFLEPFPYPGWPDMFFLPGYLLLAGGLVTILGQRSPARQMPALLDAFILAVGLAYANWVFLAGPAVGGAVSSGPELVTMAYQLIDVVIVAVAARLLLTSGAGTTSLRLLAAGVTANLAADTAYAVQASAGGFHPGTLPDQLFMMFGVLIGASALHPSMRAVAVEAEGAREGTSGLRLALLAFGIQVPADVAFAQALTGGDIEVDAAAVVSVVLTALVIARILLLATSLRDLALTDSLTGLASREALMRRLDRCAAESQRTPGRSAVVLIDLDGFKLVNDTLGHQAGDEVLRAAAARLRRLARECDTLSRLGGDEFVLLCDELDAPADAERIADRVVTVLSEPFAVDGREVRIGASVGVAALTGSGPAAALREADFALYAAKASGRGRSQLFAPEMAHF